MRRQAARARWRWRSTAPTRRIRRRDPWTLRTWSGRPRPLEPVVANIVENAVTYSPHGQPVHVSASSLLFRVELRVVVRGPGVPDEAKDRIFEPFRRHGDAPRGAGVGLAVARGFTEAIGGTLTAEDTPGGGLSMVLTLPTAGDAPSRTPELPASAIT
ncbi:sensor histidine kinase [Streptomyces flavotricini]|uniref:histidine kinase n=1 Tax=Streptomyces flavotricini TaxID=66888 RepID=A0ABS8EG16_9ACTN|nr:sensor histidine kinase [Streptomyces flavotricini]